MKNLIRILFLTLISIYSSTAQTNSYNFKSVSGEITWQKVFKTPLTLDELIETIRLSGILEEIEINGNTITGQASHINANFKGAGYSEMATPMYVPRSFFSFHSVIEYKDDKYRVTLNKFLLTQKYSDRLSKEGEQTTLETFGIKRGKDEFKSSFLKKPAEILNFTFIQKFNFNSIQPEDNW